MGKDMFLLYTTMEMVMRTRHPFTQPSVSPAKVYLVDMDTVLGGWVLGMREGGGWEVEEGGTGGRETEEGG